MRTTMQKQQYRALYSVSPSTFWSELCLSLDYQRELYMACLGCESMEVVRNDGDAATGVHRALRFRKPIDAPLAVRKMFGDAVTMEEEGTFDPSAQSFTFTYRPPMLADRLFITGRMQVTPHNGGVEVVTNTEFRCDLFGLGGILELFALNAAKESMQDKQRFTERYIVDKGLS